MESSKGQETWCNSSRGKVVIWKQDSRGDYKDHLISAEQKFVLSREDRIYNMDQAASVEQDNFSNGTLSPVRLLEGTEDAKEFASNPNLLSETDAKGLFKAHWKTFESKIGAISNANTLHRLMEVAEEVDASMKQVKIIKARLDELEPNRFVEVTSTPISGTGGTVTDRPSGRGGVTPR